MLKNKNAIGSDLAKIDAHVIQPHEYDEIPELTDEMLSTADVYHGTKLIGRGRPKKAHPKKEIKLRVDQAVLAAFKATGKGWQTRMNDVLSAWAKKHPA